jgi:hypothetical protein
MPALPKHCGGPGSAGWRFPERKRFLTAFSPASEAHDYGPSKRAAFLARAGLSAESFVATSAVIACLVDISRLGV